MKPTLVHGTMVPEITDTFSPDASDYVGSLMMRGLSCPLTWGSTVLDREDMDLKIDRLPLAVSAWDSIIQKCHLAYSEFVQGSYERGSILIAECYIPLLEVHGIEANCDLTKLYRQGLKYVLDATSAYIRLAGLEDYMDRRNLYEFVKSITYVDSMDSIQRSAVLAIRSRLSKYPENSLWAREAITLNPKEGQWHYYLAEALYEAEKQGLTCGGKERDEALEDMLKHNQLAIALCCKAPEPLFLRANLLVQNGDEDSVKRSYDCVQTALKRFPNSPYVHERAAEILQQSQNSFRLFHFKTNSYLLIEPCFKTAMKLAGKDCLSLRHKLGLHQVLISQVNVGKDFKRTHNEGMENLKKAATLLFDAKIHLQSLKEGKLNSRSLNMPVPPIFFDSGSSSGEESLEDTKTTKKKNKSKKKKKT